MTSFKIPKFRKSTLRQRTIQDLHGYIRKHFVPGDRLPSETKLATMSNVSIGTIREAMIALGVLGIVEQRHGSGTYVLDRNAQKHVALVLFLAHSQSRWGNFHLRLADYLHRFFTKEEMAARLYWATELVDSSKRDPSLEEFQRAVSRDEVAGVVIITGPNERWQTAIENSGVPVVGGDSAHQVKIDYIEFLRESVRFLTQQGRRRIGLLAWWEYGTLGMQPGQADWAFIFRELVREYGGETRDEWIRHDLHPLDEGAGYALFRELWMAHDEKPDGLVILDDTLFHDFAIAVQEIGIRVPEDVLVATLANKGSGMLYPFPTVRLEYDPDEVGRALGSLLIRRLRKEPVLAETIKISFRWVGRETIMPKVESRDPVKSNQ